MPRNTPRRDFIKLAGTGVFGLSLPPAFYQLLGTPAPFSRDFPRSSPEAQGVSSKGIRDFVEAANASNITWHSFMLVRHGHVVAEGWWKPFGPDFVHSLYSLSKSFTSTAIGLLVGEGKLDIHAPLVSWFPKDLPENPGANLQQVTVRHMLMMNTGHGADTLPKMRASQDTWTRTYLAQPVDYVPGSHFLYNTGNTYMLGAILHQITGQTLEQYLKPRLFDPLNIGGYDWEVSPQGLNTAGYGLRVMTEDIAKLGQLYLHKGVWNDKQILSESWVHEATSFQTTSQVNNGDWSQGYGYQFWRCTHNFFRGDGAYGQFCIVMPELDAVLAITSQSPDMQKSMTIAWEHLLPAIQAGAAPLPESPAEWTALKIDLASLSLPIPRGSVTSPLSSKIAGRTWTLAANEFGAQSVQFALSNESGSLSVTVDGKVKTLDFGWENWYTDGPRGLYVFNAGDMVPMPTFIAGTGTWINDHTLQVNLRFVEAIFGDVLTCSFEGDKLSISFLNSLSEGNPKNPEKRGVLVSV
jgi:CubicO group peptidase (beta-lactamase class C family)